MKALQLPLIYVFVAALVACGDEIQTKCDVEPPGDFAGDGGEGASDTPCHGGHEDGGGDEEEAPADSAIQEAEILRLLNIERSKGAVCRGISMSPVSPVQFDERLVRAARLHSRDMKARDYFAHQNPEGEGPRERMEAQGFIGNGWAENIAMGQRDAEAVIRAWMSSDAGHCENIMNRSWNVVGAGYSPPYWTLKLASAR